MIEASSQGVWKDLESILRPFIAKRLANADDADDVLQEVFLRMHRGLASLRDNQLFGPWAYRIARNTIIDHRRSRTREELPMAELPELPSVEFGEDEAHDIQRYIATFVALLASPYREALTLTELQGVSQKDAAAMLGISVSGMKSRVQRGRQKLRAALEDCCHFALDARNRVIGCDVREDAKLPDGCCQ